MLQDRSSSDAGSRLLVVLLAAAAVVVSLWLPDTVLTRSAAQRVAAPVHAFRGGAV